MVQRNVTMVISSLSMAVIIANILVTTNVHTVPEANVFFVRVDIS